jgi:hypothetical protein
MINKAIFDYYVENYFQQDLIKLALLKTKTVNQEPLKEQAQLLLIAKISFGRFKLILF